MMEKWEKNIKALASKNKGLADKIEEILLEDKINDIELKETETGKKVLGIIKNGHTWYLNSRLDPQGAAGLYADRYTIKPFYRYFIFGFSDGEAIRKLLEKCDDSNVLIICEPNIKIMAEAVRQYDLEDLFLDDRIWPCISEMWNYTCSAIFTMVEYSYIKLLEFCILPGYDVLYTKECETFMDEVIHRMHSELINKATHTLFHRRIPQNKLFHMKNIIHQRNIAQIKDALSKEGIKEMPAIIIAAGPSLDKNIKEVKKAEGKAFIFVVDAALKTVIREGIQPDIVCTVDPKAPERFYDTIEDEEILWACSGWTNYTAMKKYGKTIFYYNSIVPWWDKILQEELGYMLPQVVSGGCVSAEAFQLARYFGFQTIIFMGQDLAFTNGQSHTKGIKGVLGENDAYIKSRHLVQVEDIEGNLIETDLQMSYYRKWFEKEIQECENRLHVIDATEGGAKIAGTIVQTLKETIEQECRHETNIFNILKKIPPAFNEKQQLHLREKMNGLMEIEAEFNELVEKGIVMGTELLKELDDLDVNTLADRLKQISKQSEIIKQHPFINWITIYAQEEEFDFQDDIFAKEDMGIAEMLERSIRLFKSYQAGIPLFEEDYHEAIME